MSARAHRTSAFRPTWVTSVELSHARGELVAPATDDGPGHRYAQARVLVRLHGVPLEQLVVPLSDGRISANELDERVRDRLGERIAAHLTADGLGEVEPRDASPLPSEPPSGCSGWPPAGPRPPASVVVCTRNRPAGVLSCVRALERLDYPEFEIVVVDNAPSDDATEIALAGHDPSRVRYVVEERPGLSHARNRGVAEARGEIVAFTDDDVTVDVRWLDALVRGFARASDVVCVTGLVPAIELETAAQEFFDMKAIWACRFHHQLFSMVHSRPADPLFPFAAGEFGTGASFAVRRSAFPRVGGFDVALGAGTPSRGGEDLDFFVRVLFAQGSISYEPTAIAWHEHRREEEAFRKQLFGYGSGLTALATKQLLTPTTRGPLVRRFPHAVKRLVSVVGGGSEERRAGTPPGMRGVELRGMAAGPFLYLQGRRGHG
jgi:GT2 family glycosyltransferase